MHNRLALVIFGPPGQDIDRPQTILSEIDPVEIGDTVPVGQPGHQRRSGSVGRERHQRASGHAQHAIMALRPHPGEQFLAAEFTVAVDADPHLGRQQGQRGAQHRLLVGQPALPTMGQRDPGQRERAPAKADAHDQNGMRIPQQDAIDEQLHPLTFQPMQGRFGERLIVILLRYPLVIQQAPDALLFGGLGRVQWQRTGDFPNLGRDALPNPDHEQGQCLDLAGQGFRQLRGQLLGRAIIER